MTRWPKIRHEQDKLRQNESLATMDKHKYKEDYTSNCCSNTVCRQQQQMCKDFNPLRFSTKEVFPYVAQSAQLAYRCGGKMTSLQIRKCSRFLHLFCFEQWILDILSLLRLRTGCPAYRLKVLFSCLVKVTLYGQFSSDALFAKRRAEVNIVSQASLGMVL